VKMPMYEGKSITLGNLSDHTSSLPRMPDNFNPADALNPYADYTLDRLYAFINSCKLNRPIGSEFEYSNLAMGLLGNILASKAGMPYETLLNQKITGPLHLDETKITMDQHMKDHLAAPYSNGIKVSNWDLGSMSGAGAIRSSVHDMLLYLAANMDMPESGLSPAMHLAHTARHDKAGNASIGLNWFITKSNHGDLIWHNGATGGYRAFAGFSLTDKKGVVVLTNSDQSIDDIGFHLLDPAKKLATVKPSIASKLKEWIDKKGSKHLLDRYEDFKKKNADTYDYDENEINALGYWYLGQKKVDAAKAIFEINVKEFPESSNVYDSYGEALMDAGQKEEAISNYKKSLELNPGNSNAVEMLAKMGVTYESNTVNIDEQTLESYVGTYQLAPGFNIVITRQGSQLTGQATGQSSFELFPKSATEFYLKVVVARIVFSKDPDGNMMMTLYQSGQVLPGKRI
ncbi:MAG TPA: serine hydrolase, partial [Saprospiraceae bacterium]|nr:serine hydrolase [Saprospiraceae bacterium]